MPYSALLAREVRNYLISKNVIATEKAMFGGLAFLVEGKMCINVSGQRLMCRFHPGRQTEIERKPGYEPMMMRGRQMAGYCYVQPEGYASTQSFQYWADLCLAFNKDAKSSAGK